MKFHVPSFRERLQAAGIAQEYDEAPLWWRLMKRGQAANLITLAIPDGGRMPHIWPNPLAWGVN